jgi:5-methylcytosine-specific restriction endonuclease McrA
MGRLSQWHDWYKTSGWAKRRAYQLRIAPLCKMCLDKGELVPARVADHVEPHRGNYNLFVLGALQSLCFDCHDRKKRGAELRGYGSEMDEHGWPTDPAHPTNVRARATGTDGSK